VNVTVLPFVVVIALGEKELSQMAGLALVPLHPPPPPPPPPPPVGLLPPQLAAIATSAATAMSFSECIFSLLVRDEMLTANERRWFPVRCC
jgi:hypothetical protein